MSAVPTMPLPLPVEARCGYCGEHLTAQPEGDFACTPCRGEIARVVVGPPGALAGQWAAFQAAASSRVGGEG